MAGSTKQRKVLAGILGVGLLALAADRFFSESPLTGPSDAQAASDPAGVAGASAPGSPAFPDRIITVREQLARAAIGPTAIESSGDPFAAPPAWVRELLAAAAEREKKAVADPPEPGDVTPTNFRLVAVMVETTPATGTRTVAMVEVTDGARRGLVKVAQGDALGEYVVAQVNLPAPDAAGARPGSVVIEHAGPGGRKYLMQTSGKPEPLSAPR